MTSKELIEFPSINSRWNYDYAECLFVTLFSVFLFILETGLRTGWTALAVIKVNGKKWQVGRQTKPYQMTVVGSVALRSIFKKRRPRRHSCESRTVYRPLSLSLSCFSFPSSPTKGQRNQNEKLQASNSVPFVRLMSATGFTKFCHVPCCWYP